MITFNMVSKSEKERLKPHIEELKQIEDKLFDLGGSILDSTLCEAWSDLYTIIEALEHCNV